MENNNLEILYNSRGSSTSTTLDIIDLKKLDTKEFIEILSTTESKHDRVSMTEKNGFIIINSMGGGALTYCKTYNEALWSWVFLELGVEL